MIGMYNTPPNTWTLHRGPLLNMSSIFCTFSTFSSPAYLHLQYSWCKKPDRLTSSEVMRGMYYTHPNTSASRHWRLSNISSSFRSFVDHPSTFPTMLGLASLKLIINSDATFLASIQPIGGWSGSPLRIQIIPYIWCIENEQSKVTRRVWDSRTCAK